MTPYVHVSSNLQRSTVWAHVGNTYNVHAHLNTTGLEEGSIIYRKTTTTRNYNHTRNKL